MDSFNTEFSNVVLDDDRDQVVTCKDMLVRFDFRYGYVVWPNLKQDDEIHISKEALIATVTNSYPDIPIPSLLSLLNDGHIVYVSEDICRPTRLSNKGLKPLQSPIPKVDINSFSFGKSDVFYPGVPKKNK